LNPKTIYSALQRKNTDRIQSLRPNNRVLGGRVVQANPCSDIFELVQLSAVARSWTDRFKENKKTAEKIKLFGSVNRI